MKTPLTKSKRAQVILICMFLWLSFGIYCIEKGVDLKSMAAYFASLAAFVAPYIMAETKRPSEGK